MENEEEEKQDEMQEGNNDDRYTKVENDVYNIEGYDEEKPEEHKEDEVVEAQPNSKETQKKSNTKKQIKKFNIILLGEKGVGKSSLIDRYVNNKFSNFENAEVKENVKVKKYEVDKDITAELSIHDTTEFENMGKFPRSYFVDAHGAILVFNIADLNSFNKLQYWREELTSNGPGDIVICYLGNQADKIADRKVDSEEIKKFVGNNLYFDVSAKTGNNVSLAFEKLTNCIIEKQKEEENNPDKYVRGPEGRKTTRLNDVQPPKKKKCC